MKYERLLTEHNIQNRDFNIADKKFKIGVMSFELLILKSKFSKFIMSEQI